MKCVQRSIALLAVFGIRLADPCFALDSVIAAGLKGDGVFDNTGPLQEALDAGDVSLHFPAGTYALGAVTVHSDTRLTFDPGAKILPLRDRIVYTEEVEIKGRRRKVERKNPLFTVRGSRVRLEGLRFDFCSGGTEKDPTPVLVLIHAEDAAHVVVSGFHVETSSTNGLKRGERRQLVRAENCAGLVLENSSALAITDMMWATYCEDVTVRGNRMIGGAAMTTFAFGSQSLRHHDNWSRNVGYQCVWRGGSPDPSRKAPAVPLGTADTVIRGTRPEDADYIPHTSGVFDVMVQNNYAEYGTVLCWGNKGRQTIVDGNIARFMWDYAYGSEGGENLVFSNNISVNSAVAGFMSLYWGEKVLITGNLVIVRHEEMDPAFTSRAPGVYMGQFVRLHHGPSNPEDRYGAGTVEISGNLFVNELAGRPSGISIEGGRDVRIAGNKIVNGLLRKSDERVRVKATEKDKADEFASQIAAADAGEVRMDHRVGDNLSRITVMGNEFISRQPGDKPGVLINGTVSTSIVKDNVFRKETSILDFTEKQLTAEATPPRYMLYAEDDVMKRNVTNATPAVAIDIAPFTSNYSFVQGNLICGWRDAIRGRNASPDGALTVVMTGNSADGAVGVAPDSPRTVSKVEGNIELPRSPLR